MTSSQLIFLLVVLCVVCGLAWLGLVLFAPLALRERLRHFLGAAEPSQLDAGNGWVERVASSGDRRRLPVRLTPAGRAKLEQATPVIEALFQRYQAGRPADEMARFSAELQDFYQRVRDSCPTAPDPDQI